jgi:DNA modification methylase
MSTKESWEYAEADTQQHVHGLHPYPARMIPQIAHRLIREWSDEGDTVLDPFCGSGTVLVEALLQNRNAVGVDINPLAYLIAKVKTTKLNPEILNQEIESILDEVQQKMESFKKGTYNVKTYVFSNIFHWFKRDVADKLTIIKDSIADERYINEDIFNLLQVCFSMTIRKASNIAFEDNPYFIRSKTGEDLKKHSPDVLKIFQEQVMDTVLRLNEFSKLYPNGVKCSVYETDARALPLEDNSIDLIVTSPPYGEESHTMSYSRFAKLSLLWFGMTPSDLRYVERRTLGGNEISLRPLTENLDLQLKEISKKNEKRAKEVFSFIWSYENCLKEMYRVLAPNSYIGIVIGDRSAAGVPVSNGIITKQLGELMGFEQVITYQREIPKKVLPRRDYKVELINKEHIIIMKKP